MPTASETALEQIVKYRKSCWDWAQACVWTSDQADKENPIKKYPNKVYLKYMMEQMVSDHLLALVKHRRMLMTWTACVIGAWDFAFHEGRKIAFISKKEEDSDELVKRCKFILDNADREAWLVRPTYEYKFCNLYSNDTNSQIVGVAQGPDQLRQHTLSRIFGDEMGFWPSARQTYVAMKPTIQGGGQICLISTRFPGFFKKLIEDTLDD